MSSLFIDRRNIALSLDGGALVFREKDVRIGTVPIAPLDRVFIRGGVTVDTSVLSRLGDEGVGVIILDGRKDEVRMFLPPYHNDAQRRLAQYVLSLDEDFCREAAFTVVREKIQACRNALEVLKQTYPLHDTEFDRLVEMLDVAVERLAVMRSVDSIRGVEGQAATSYFSALRHFFEPTLAFKSRNKRPPRDPVNAVLSLSYTLLVAEAGLALHAVGLDPMVGYLHKLDFGRPSLACDLMEPARPLIDQFVVGLFHRKVLQAEDFSTTDKGCFMNKPARARFYPAYEEAGGGWRSLLEQNALRVVDNLVDAFHKRYPKVASVEANASFFQQKAVVRSSLVGSESAIEDVPL